MLKKREQQELLEIMKPKEPQKKQLKISATIPAAAKFGFKEEIINLETAILLNLVMIQFHLMTKSINNFLGGGNEQNPCLFNQY